VSRNVKRDQRADDGRSERYTPFTWSWIH